MRHDDGLGGQFQIGIEVFNGRIIPFADFAHEDGRQGGAVQLEFARFDTWDIEHRHDTAHDGGKLHQAGFFQVLRLQGLVGAAEIHGLGLSLGDAAAGADGLIIDFHPIELVVFMSPLRIDGERKGSPGAVD